MDDAVRLLGAFAIAALAAGLWTPVAHDFAVKSRFYDQPAGYKKHLSPTPYLGGVAVIAGFGLAAVAFGDGFARFGWLLACAFALLAVGTLDDRVGLPIATRLIVQAATAIVLWTSGLGWDVFPGNAADLILTIVWVVGLINAFNLMDNLDGAAATVASVCAAGAGAVAIVEGDVPLAALTFALAGACAGFLPYNLAKPSRIFLGDGGSMPIGFVVAAAIMLMPHGGLDWTAVLASAPLVALPIFDTTLVVVSRYRRHAPILEGGRDHLTHRLLAHLGTEREVALRLGGAQALMCGLAIALHEAHPSAVVAAVSLTALAGAVMVAALETERMAPARVGPTG